MGEEWSVEQNEMPWLKGPKHQEVIQQQLHIAG